MSHTGDGERGNGVMDLRVDMGTKFVLSEGTHASYGSIQQEVFQPRRKHASGLLLLPGHLPFHTRLEGRDRSEVWEAIVEVGETFPH